MKRLLTTLFSLLTPILLFAQDTDNSTTAFDLRSSGKIYVVVAVIVVVFVGIAFYLFSIDKRLKKIERNN